MLKEKIKAMGSKITEAYVTAHCKVNAIKEDENAMEVIQVVMLIAVGVIAIAAVWAGINGLLKQWWDTITQNSNTGVSGPDISVPGS